MIVVKIAGGLGNQMMQYATGRALSLQRNVPLYLDLGWYENNRDLQFPRAFKLKSFNTKFKTVNLSKIGWKLRYTNRFLKLNPFRLKLIKDEDIETAPIGFDGIGNNTLLEGFFQNYNNFNSIRQLLAKEFTPVEKMDAVNTACLQKIISCNSVSVHIRRGDYALTDFHGMLGVAYYEKAIELIAQKKGALQLFIFSDEPDWVLQNMHFDYPYELVDFNRDEKSYFDMELMKHCKHHIIANSSFSWWPAWLSPHADKMVIAPEKWFSADNKTNGLIPEDWIRL